MNNLDILYEDNHLIVVMKPHNVLSQGDATGDIDLLTQIKKYIKEEKNKPGNVYLGLVHRLDRPTRGIMVYAKTSKAAKRLSEAIKKHEFKKEYILVCHGKIANSGTMEDYIQKVDKKAIINKKDGKLAQLSYQLIAYNKMQDLSLVKVSLKTGRYNQIRVQFASRGYPLYGDNKYGNKDNEQLCLTANILEFYHPVTKELLHFTCDIDYSLKGYSFFKEVSK